MPPLTQPLHELQPVERSDPRHAPILGSRAWHWRDEDACRASAGALAGHAALHDAVIELHGPLGAGKTTFTRHLLRALGVEGRIKSPTFAVMEPYSLPGLQISHFDFYRFDRDTDWEDAGLRDVFAAPGLKIVEWPEQGGIARPRPDLCLTISIDTDEARTVQVDALSPRGLELLS